MSLATPEPQRKPRSLWNAGGAGADVNDRSARLLAWYDRHRRDLPWRARPGAASDPYRVWVSEIMLQQTTVGAVVPYYQRFLARFPTVEALAAADLDAVLRLWAGLGYYARGRNLHACAQVIVAQHGGEFPRSLAGLRALPGIGDYTAAAIGAIAFDLPTVPVDGNVERVVARLFAIDAPLPGAKPLIREAASTLVPPQRSGDFAQALMDLGATICTPKSPACLHCPWRSGCVGQARGGPERLPVKEAKSPGRLRRGAAFVVWRDDGAVLARTRPAKGLLGGMTEVPTTDWTHDFDEGRALAAAPRFSAPTAVTHGRRKSRRAGEATGDSGVRWRRLPGVVTHVFTHFPLELIVYLGHVPAGATAPAGMRWIAAADVAAEAFPGVMRKVLTHARP